jgi:hypothetical protein
VAGDAPAASGTGGAVAEEVRVAAGAPVPVDVPDADEAVVAPLQAVARVASDIAVSTGTTRVNCTNVLCRTSSGTG